MSIEIYKNLYFKLPFEIQKVIDSYVDPEYDYYIDKVREVEKEYQIHKNGFYNRYPSSTKEISYSDFTMNNIKNIVQCLREIPFIIKRIKNHKSKYAVGSYGGKHAIEKYRKIKTPTENCYISNGEFIIAMILLGYAPKVESLNCIFNAVYIHK